MEIHDLKEAILYKVENFSIFVSKEKEDGRDKTAKIQEIIMEENKIVKETFPVLDMSCAACATRVDRTLNRQDGVCSASVNYAAATATVEYDPTQCSPEQLKKALQEEGYDLLITADKNLNEEATELREEKYRKLKRKTIAAVVLSLPVAILGMTCMDNEMAHYAMWILSTPVVFWLGGDFFANSWKQLKHRTANMDTLVAESTGIAYLFSLFNLFFPSFWLERGLEPHVYFEAASVIITFILLGRLLEERAKGNTSTALKKLMGLQPKKVTVINSEGKNIEIPIEEIRRGDLLLVKPGEKIAVDGQVEEGHSFVDESMLSGESIPVQKQPMSKVYAGTINQKGSFSFRAEKVGAETLLAQIIRMVQDAQGSKAPVQKLVDRIAAVFVPTIMAIALIACISWMIFDPTDGITHGLMAGVTVLIIACPCALGLATPTAIMVGIGKGAELGILIKDAESLETAKSINAIVLDKTGTITEGRPRVTDSVGLTEKNTARIFYSLEKLSEHPLAEAIAEYLSTDTVKIDNFESLTGRGVCGKFEDRWYFAGSLRLLKEKGVSIDDALTEKAEQWKAEAKSVIGFANEEKVLGLAAIADEIKETSAAAIQELRKMHIDIHMLTGDNEATARAIAEKVGIRHFKAEVLPQEKADYIRKLQAGGNKVAMVGDGINDSAALAAADLSVAMGQGSDIAIDVAQMTVISSDLRKLCDAIRLSSMTVQTIRQNLFWAFIYNLVSVPIAAGILYPINGFLLNPMIAGAAMAMSSVSVVSNSLRLKHKKLGTIKQMSNIKTVSTMKKNYKIEGMMCNHCRMHVEKALNQIDGVQATVSLEPPVATVEFTKGEKSLAELQAALEPEGYTIKDMD